MSITAYTHGGSQGRSTSQWRSYDLVYKASVADLRMSKFDPVKMADITTLVHCVRPECVGLCLLQSTLIKDQDSYVPVIKKI